jgi:hypothetical protein
MAWDDTDAGDGTLQSSEYNNLVDAIKNRPYVGHFVVTGTGSQSITGVGFQPSTVKFEIHSNGGVNVDTAGGGGASVSNNASQMTGYAKDDGTRQNTGTAVSGNSINEIRRWSDDSRAIYLQYADQDGARISAMRADVSSFDSDGFTLSINTVPQNEIIFFTAYG